MLSWVRLNFLICEPVQIQKFTLWPDLWWHYVLVRSSDLEHKEEKWSKALNTNKVNRFQHLWRNLVIIRPPLSINIKVSSFLKHNVHEWSLLVSTAVSHNILHKDFAVLILQRLTREFLFSYLFHWDKTIHSH